MPVHLARNAFSVFVVLAITVTAGTASSPRLVWLDLDRDGLEDLLHYVPGGAGHLLLNAGDGTFEVVDAGLDALPGPLHDAARLDLQGRGHALALATSEQTLLVEILDGIPRVVARLPRRSRSKPATSTGMDAPTWFSMAASIASKPRGPFSGWIYPSPRPRHRIS